MKTPEPETRTLSLSIPDETCPQIVAGENPHPNRQWILNEMAPTRPSERETLFNEFSPLVRRLIRQYGRTQEIRQDLPGELYCRFHTLLDSYDPNRGVPLRPYLVRQLTAAAFAFARRQWTWAQREAPLIEGAESGYRQPISNPTDEWDADLAQRETIAALSKLIDALPARQRQVVRWRYYEEKSFEEIAHTLGIQESSVRSLLRHGMNNLRQRVSEYQNDNV